MFFCRGFLGSPVPTSDLRYHESLGKKNNTTHVFFHKNGNNVEACFFWEGYFFGRRSMGLIYLLYKMYSKQYSVQWIGDVVPPNRASHDLSLLVVLHVDPSGFHIFELKT